ncbi:glycoside hydrolase superfamily [Aspergillus lucknowensis]|uniref:chitinase n=1 Tax=Aspergillus lucknowensis TaxID=176173 RepID=A0ABR4LU99_9EURO
MRRPLVVFIAAIWTVAEALCVRQSVCPAPCSSDPGKWTPYRSPDQLNACDRPVLLDFSSHGSYSPDAAFMVFACTLDDHLDAPSEARAPLRGERTEPDLLNSTITAINSHPESRLVDFVLAHFHTLLAQTPSRNARSLLWRLNGISVGVYSGAKAGDDSVISAIQGVQNWRFGPQPRKSAAIQLCGHDQDGDHTFGMAFDTSGNIGTVQKALNSWANGRCVENDEKMLHVEDISRGSRLPGIGRSNSNTDDIDSEPSEEHGCVTETVLSGDSCTTLAERCDISGDDFMQYNPEDSLCATLQPGQKVCCSSRVSIGEIPGMNHDGSCFSYTVQSDDTCFSIGEANSLDESNLSHFNDRKTWGWYGCDLLYPGQRICLSKGYPPAPAPKRDAVCGPTVPGTMTPTDGTTLSELNPCPLNACCNTLGKCGVSPEFCIREEGPTGNPGTAPADSKGCVSNCGLQILNNSAETTGFMRIGYFESFNLDRPCLHLHAKHINVSEYTHIHWGFATLNSTFHIQVNDTNNQWSDFLALEGVKKIVSFGCWGSSINSGSLGLLREAMHPANVDTFIVNIMTFVEDNKLDGVDFDWEYPGTSNGPSILLEWISDGPNYLAFLKRLRKIFSRNKTVSMTAPACYWYLRVFPLAEMWPHLDYIVYMTYDLHGQWDYGSTLAQDWCDGGNCLRSHVNLTETEYALAMITKAGVPRNIIAVGVASYGRAFGMTEAGCTGPECTFEGPQSAATPGPCTKTPGVLSNAEIEDLIIGNNFNELYYDEASDSEILVYDDTQWVAFMSRGTMARRMERYRDLGFAGTANWAIDLEYRSVDETEADDGGAVDEEPDDEEPDDDQPDNDEPGGEEPDEMDESSQE